jgi:hypothetical protein
MKKEGIKDESIPSEQAPTDALDATSFNKSYDKFISQLGVDRSQISRSLVKKDKWNE